MKAGDYCRTKSGWICKLDYYDEKEKRWITHDENDWYPVYETQIKISSPNIIDLIEIGDYVNGLPVERIGRTLDDENDIRVWFGVATYGRTTLNQINHRYTVKDELEDDYSLRFRCIKPEDIKSIVTKEQFSQIEYKVGE